MTPVAFEAFVGGLLTGGYLCVGLFFLRFWARTRDALFAAFAAAFALLAAGQATPLVLGLAEEDKSGVYLLRLGAFGLIISAIVAKNLRARRRSQGRPLPPSRSEPGGL